MSLKSIKGLKEFVASDPITVVVFSTYSCSVCKPLKVKIEQITRELEVAFEDVFIEDVEEAKGLYQVYTSPIVILFIEGREAMRYSAAMDIKAFYATIVRYKELMA